jgi:hypothetical protein
LQKQQHLLPRPTTRLANLVPSWLIFLNGNQQGTRAWRLDSAATVKTRAGSVAIQNMERDAPWTAWIKMIQQRGEASSSAMDFRL